MILNNLKYSVCLFEFSARRIKQSIYISQPLFSTFIKVRSFYYSTLFFFNLFSILLTRPFNLLFDDFNKLNNNKSNYNNDFKKYF